MEIQTQHHLDGATHDFYLHALHLLDEARVAYLVGGGYAMAHMTGIVRHTKDLDLFLRETDRDRALEVLAAAGYRTEITWPHFLAKAMCGEAFVDLIYNSGNGLSPVDDQWFDNAVRGQVLGRAVAMCPPEETLWSKAFVMDRDRFDGADVAHLILAQGQRFDWHRLMRRFHTHERVLLSHLLLFGYIYPSERHIVPGWVVDELVDAMAKEPPVSERVCRGTFLAIRQYLPDVREWGFADPRLRPRGPLTAEEIATLPAA
jgi:hypothetical protein